MNDLIISKYPDEYEHSGKVAYINENKSISVETLLEFLLIYSANDAAYISALAVSEDVEQFILLMNQKSKKLGMNNTNFVNPDGIDDENHYTTLNDLLILTKHIIENNQIISTVSKSKFLSDASGIEKTYKNTNLLLDEGFTGIKTGWTDKAGLTFIGYNQLNKREIITIVNRSNVDERKYNHFSDTKILYKSSIETFNNYKIVNKDTLIYQIRSSNNLYKHTSENDWITFINKNQVNTIKLNKYEKNKLTFIYSNDLLTYKIKKKSNSINWRFNPIKIFKINANK
tara:strand:- start:246 stop:1103 length:858 start_codon:yes stop_codon:yes gene_type:complete